MITIHYCEEYIRKAEMKHYPLQGYWIQLGQKYDTNNLFYQWYQGSSDIYSCNTFIEDNQVRISFDISALGNDIQNRTHLIYLIALDLNRFTDITTDFSGSKDPKLFSQLAGIIDLGMEMQDPDVINKQVTDIFDLGYLPKCSFKLNNGQGQIQVSHYNSNEVGRVSAYDKSLQDKQFIEKSSGIDFARIGLSASKPADLNGVMTIKKSGLIQL